MVANLYVRSILLFLGDFPKVSISQPCILKFEIPEGAFGKDLPLVFILFASHNDSLDAFFVLCIMNKNRNLSMGSVLLCSTLRCDGILSSFGPVNLYI